jgi:hypothetical protein
MLQSFKIIPKALQPILRLTALVGKTIALTPYYMPPKLALAKLVELLVITQIRPTYGKMENCSSKHYQS